MAVANILDSIHDQLDSRVWDDPGADKPALKPKHLHWIKKTVYGALEQGGYAKPEDWLKMVLTGSLTTYQYSDESDCDVSLFVDSSALPEWSRAEMIGIMIGHVDGITLPGTPHPMQDFVVGRKITPRDLYKPGLRSGYDLDTQTWIEPPDRNRVHDVAAEENGFYSYALQMADKMERLLRYEPDKAIDFWHSIHKKRMRDMSSGKGDFAESNIIYKFLANRGLFPAISQASGEYIAKTAANVLYNQFRPDSLHPKTPGEQALPFIYDPQTEVVHLGPARSYHWQLIQHTPELRDQYAGAWEQPAFQANQDHIHGAMRWPSKNLDFLGGQIDPQVKSQITQALGAPEEDHDWDFN